MFSKNGSIPKPETDSTEGWIEVPDAPECPAGKEVVWWYPPGWIIRDPKPEGNWNWSQAEERWVQHVPQIEQIQIVDINTQTVISIDTPTFTSTDIPALTSSDIQAL